MNHTAEQGRSPEDRKAISEGVTRYWQSPEGRIERSKRRAKAREARISAATARLRSET